LIENYHLANSHLAGYPRDFIDELFTEDRTFADEGVTTVEEQKLPIPNNMMGVGAIAVGWGDDFYMLCNKPEYPLPFKVWGYFDLRDCELTDKQKGLETKRWEIRRLIQNIEDERLDAALAALTNAADQIPAL
jgi:hypothetical protein